ncbi:hypothetical protein [Microbacterium algeriense]|uniref:Uncharacterized protein n=1 Tax=Microbacterium algeriense TaxID=2615184 RepID=A0ABQ6VAL0_9MICO|nr:hypothetical protein [Microbacterium algeriense]KAB1867311.1 hypothetical protein F6A08_05860 [Microbacterium algeriense]
MTVNFATGEVTEEEAAAAGMDMVPLNLAALSEDELIAMLPTPVQCAGALQYARQVAARAPKALNELRTALTKRERELTIAVALGARDLLAEYPRLPMSERRDIARATDTRVQDAQEARDTAWLLLEYARDYDRAIGRDIDILRSLNANFRGEHR